MSKRKKLLLALAALFLVATSASVLILQSSWFAGFARQRLVSAVEESTGGRVEIAAFELDWSNLTIRVRNFVLHGTEPRNAKPLVRVPYLEIRARILGLDYVGVRNPQVNVIASPDGSTNIPRPKIAPPPSNKPGIETVVDLAIKRFEIENGLLVYQQKEITFGARGEHLHALLNYDQGNPSYAGSLSIDPLLLTYPGRPPVQVHVNIPVTIDKGAVSIQSAQLALGQTTLQASGRLSPGKDSAVQFNVNLALAEVGSLLNLPLPRMAGDLKINGHAKLAANATYAVDGNLSSVALSLRDGATQISGVTLDSPFHADPHLLSLDALRLHILGGDVTAKIFFEDLKRLNAQGNVRSVPIPALAAALGQKRLGYDGSVSGSFAAKGDSTYSAQAHLNVTPGKRGIPVSGQINADYTGANSAISLKKSFVSLPHSRVDFNGTLNRELAVNLISHDLNDFLPIGPLPIALAGGTATVQAKVLGNLSAPKIDGHIVVTQFAAQERTFDYLAADLSASQSGAVVQNGSLHGKTLQTDFDGSLGLKKWKPVSASALNLKFRVGKGDVKDLLSLAGEASIPASGQLTADAHINGTYGNPQGAATLQVVNGTAYGQPFQRLSGKVDLSDQRVTLSNMEVDIAGGRVSLDGTFQHPRDSFTTGHAQFHVSTENLQLANLTSVQRQNLGVAGLLRLKAGASVEVGKAVTISDFTTDLSTGGLKIRNQDIGSLTVTARTAQGALNYNLASNFAGSEIKVNGRTSLTANYVTVADASVQRLSIQKALDLTGQSTIPARGEISAQGRVSGTLESPDANLNFTLSRANLYGEPVDNLQGSVHYSNAGVDVPSFKLDMPAGSLSLTGNLNRGSLRLQVSSGALQLAKIAHVHAMHPGIAGALRLNGDLAAGIKHENGKSSVLISGLTADLAADDLRFDKRDFGRAAFTAKTTGSNVEFHLDSNVAGSQVHGSGQAQLVAGYPVRANLTFANVRYANLSRLIVTGADLKPGFDATVEGKASVEGPALDPQKLSARLQLDTFSAEVDPRESLTGTAVGRTAQLRNDGPLIASLKGGVVQLEQFRLQGAHTTATASGAIDLNNSSSPLRLQLEANADVGILQDISRDFYSSGGIVLRAAVRGTLDHPLVNGRVELKNANVNYSGSPNGLSNGNGVILLNGTTATIQNLTGESGGGKVTLSGFVGYGTSLLNYNVRASASRVRVRYADVSLTCNASLSLTGNSRRSLLGGTVTVERLAYTSSTDAGSLLSVASAPPANPAEPPSGLLSGMRLDIRAVTAPDMRVVTTYAERLDVFSNLTIRGTVLTPGVLGRVNVTNGRLLFFGNTYTVNTGTIDFYNPNSIEPILNASLETTAQGVDVNIGVSGPMSDLKLTYRSDPPLTFEQIVQLLATNTTPSDPTIAAHQPTPAQQSVGQMGESAILGQAVANPLASRVQRVFGLTQFKIDPSLSGSNGQPSARVTLQQKIASNITFTYITDVTQTNSEIVRVQWDFSPAVSAVALRDFNGNVSVEVFYKFKKR